MISNPGYLHSSSHSFTSSLLFQSDLCTNSHFNFTSVISDYSCTSMQMKTCHSVHGLLALRLSTLMIVICAVELHLVCNSEFQLHFTYFVLFSFFFFLIFVFVISTEFTECEWKAQAGNACVASFDWRCSGICRSVERIKDVHSKCAEGTATLWSVLL